MSDTAISPVRARPQVALFRTLLLSHARLEEVAQAIVEDTCGLSMREFDMIAELGGQPAMKMGDLSARMVTSPSSVTRIAKALEARGLLQRHRSEASEREVFATLTAEGQAFFDRHFHVVAERISAYFDGRLDVAAQQELRSLLDRLR